MSGVHHPRGTSTSRRAEQTEYSTAHERQAHHPAHGRGQFGGYTFRVGRAPTQAGLRRPQRLRPRPPPPQAQAQSSGDGMHIEADLSQRASTDIDDDKRRRTPVIDTENKDAGGQHQRPPSPPQPHLKARLPPPTPAPAQTLETRLRQAGWPGADILLGDAASQGGTAPQYVQALVAGLLAATLPPAARPAAAGSGTVLGMALMAAFLRIGTNAQDLSTLAKVKHLAMARREAQGPRPRDLPLTDAERSANVLAIPQLLNAARPRTPAQCGQAIDRLGLLVRSSSAQGIRA